MKSDLEKKLGAIVVTAEKAQTDMNLSANSQELSALESELARPEA